ncbi:hypothetical protein H696_01805 [Fonticula alba]|uniref:Uncharacterized protein n=1 Tax=Fonticula alba TaxID=691883 RepID=A0A058ZDE3_FONAL|nr:hypothetical protein H696_01805 [Fonticula alba]KCV72409.1 hypothetical protein H696_01805 [Fonticula alba]|eukprot:XP_009493987.1 hypothetical protein H696_01805 [Fonticula alba]
MLGQRSLPLKSPIPPSWTVPWVLDVQPAAYLGDLFLGSPISDILAQFERSPTTILHQFVVRYDRRPNSPAPHLQLDVASRQVTLHFHPVCQRLCLIDVTISQAVHLSYRGSLFFSNTGPITPDDIIDAFGLTKSPVFGGFVGGNGATAIAILDYPGISFVFHFPAAGLGEARRPAIGESIRFPTRLPSVCQRVLIHADTALLDVPHSTGLDPLDAQHSHRQSYPHAAGWSQHSPPMAGTEQCGSGGRSPRLMADPVFGGRNVHLPLLWPKRPPPTVSPLQPAHEPVVLFLDALPLAVSRSFCETVPALVFPLRRLVVRLGQGSQSIQDRLGAPCAVHYPSAARLLPRVGAGGPASALGPGESTAVAATPPVVSSPAAAHAIYHDRALAALRLANENLRASGELPASVQVSSMSTMLDLHPLTVDRAQLVDAVRQHSSGHSYGLGHSVGNALPLADLAGSASGRPGNNDYILHYAILGVDILVCGVSHRAMRFILRTNVPGHAGFGRVRRCNFQVVSDRALAGPEARRLLELDEMDLAIGAGWRPGPSSSGSGVVSPNPSSSASVSSSSSSDAGEGARSGPGSGSNASLLDRSVTGLSFFWDADWQLLRRALASTPFGVLPVRAPGDGPVASVSGLDTQQPYLFVDESGSDALGTFGPTALDGFVVVPPSPARGAFEQSAPLSPSDPSFWTVGPTAEVDPEEVPLRSADTGAPMETRAVCFSVESTRAGQVASVSTFLGRWVAGRQHTASPLL